MPELPEVETIRRQLEQKAVGEVIRKIEILEPKMFIGDPKDIIGSEIVGVGRTAKVLRICLANGAAFLVHFKLNGQFFGGRRETARRQGSPGQSFILRAARVCFSTTRENSDG